MTLYKQKLLEFSNVDEPTNNFTTNFNPPLIIDEDSLIALQLFSMELLPESIEINETNNKIGFAVCKPDAKTYLNQLENHTVKIKDGKYNSKTFALEVNKLLNSTMFFNRSAYSNEQGCEFNISISNDKMTTIKLAFTLDDEYTSPPVDETKYSTDTYTYTNDPNVLQRVDADINTFSRSDFLFTDNIFCRGSGITSLYDSNSRYRYYGIFTFSGGNTIFTFYEDDITLDEFGYVKGDVVRFNSSGEHTISVDVTLNSSGNIVLTFDTADITLDEDYMLPGNRCSGFVIGLVKSENIGELDLFNKIDYGISVLPDGNSYNFTSGNVYLKYSSSEDWINTYYTLDDGYYTEEDQRYIGLAIGRLTDSDMDNYKIHYCDLDNTQSKIRDDHIFASKNYDYGDYRLVIGMMSYEFNLKNILWTESKLSNKYIPPNPQRNDLDMMLRPDKGIGFYGNRSGYVTLNFFNSETAILYGYYLDQIVSENILNVESNIVQFDSNRKINTLFGLPESLRVSIDIPLESYSRGLSSRCISYIPNNQISNNPILVYSPPDPVFLSLNNLKKMYLDHITFRLENSSGELSSPQLSCTIALLIRSKYI